MAVQPRSSVSLVAAVVIAASLAGCGSSGTSASPSSVAVTRAPTSSLAATTATVTITEKDRGRTVRVRAGQRLRVVLNSTYWTMKPVTHWQVLAPDGNPVTSPEPSGCVPGGGCGSVTAVYDAVGPGSAELTATRTSCGEAMGCAASDATWMVTVLVR